MEKMENEERRSTSARQNWRKVFAVRKFLSLAKFQSQQPPADLLVGQVSNLLTFMRAAFLYEIFNVYLLFE